MHRYSIPERTAWTKLIPRSAPDRRRLRAICGFAFFLTVFLAAWIFFNHRRHEDVELHWDSAIATIEDVRTKPVALVDGRFGRAMLYEVSVLARYRKGNTDEERRITVQQQPRLLADAQLEAFRWQGKQCTVRWNPSNPSQRIAEVS